MGCYYLKESYSKVKLQMTAIDNSEYIIFIEAMATFASF